MLRQLPDIVRSHGVGWMAWRLTYLLARRSPWFRWRLPGGPDYISSTHSLLGSHDQADLARIWRSSPGPFFLPADRGVPAEDVSDASRAVADADAIVDGRLHYFQAHWRSVETPPAWHRSPATGSDWPASEHWSLVEELGRPGDDVKWVWEASRFTHVFTLARAYAATGDERYAEVFWQHCLDWLRANPPERGVNWGCGQEASLRALAWLFGLQVFREARATTDERVSTLITALAYHAHHIDRVHWYARRCVRNNHAISEAVALWSLGTCLPWLPSAKRWRQRGWRSLGEELNWQIYADGSYVQHSFNYSRLVADLGTWVLSLARAADQEVPLTIRQPLERLLDFLLAHQFGADGSLPNYGANDGALLFPLSGCEYRDFRPALTSLTVALGRARPWPEGPWDEESRWFGWPLGASRTDALEVPEPAAVTSFPEGGYHGLHQGPSRVMVRCGRYRHRPLQADMLHVDFWWNGQNVLADPGTYSYNPPAGWGGHFPGTASHNTVTVDGQDQMTRGPRFMWLHWVQGEVLGSGDEDGSWIAVQHTGYSPARHRRLIHLANDGSLTVVDLISGLEHARPLTLQWLTGELQLEGEDGQRRFHLADDTVLEFCTWGDAGASESWVQGCEPGPEAEPRGWLARHYGAVEPAWSGAWTVTAKTARFVSWCGPSTALPISADEVIQRLPDTVEPWLA